MKKILSIGFIVVSSIGLLTMSYHSDKTSYEYAYVIQDDKELRIVLRGHEIESSQVQVRDRDSDYRPAFGKLENLEQEGWELVSNSIIIKTGFPTNYFLLRRRK